MCKALAPIGVCIALINWRRIERKPAGDIVSRGEVTTALAGKSCSTDIADAIATLTLRKPRPFCLIAVVPSEQTLTERRWNLEWLAARAHPSKAQHWFSSGFDERKPKSNDAACVSRRTTDNCLRVLHGMRRLHRSHAPEPGPFSICMHRAGAGTVSYTEVAVSPKWLVMRYKNGTPCSTKSTITRALPLL